jgi:hypothetical protein
MEGSGTIGPSLPKGGNNRRHAPLTGQKIRVVKRINPSRPKKWTVRTLNSVPVGRKRFQREKTRERERTKEREKERERKKGKERVSDTPQKKNRFPYISRCRHATPLEKCFVTRPSSLLKLHATRCLLRDAFLKMDEHDS